MNYGRKFIELAYDICQDHASQSGTIQVTKDITLFIRKDYKENRPSMMVVTFGSGITHKVEVLFVPLNFLTEPDVQLTIRYEDRYNDPRTDEDWEALLASCTHQYALIMNLQNNKQ